MGAGCRVIAIAILFGIVGLVLVRFAQVVFRP